MHLNQRLQRSFIQLVRINPCISSFHSDTAAAAITKSSSITHDPCLHHRQPCLPKQPKPATQRRMFSWTGKVSGEDENIPMPFGVIGARRWGDPSKSPVLVIHGWKDNLASFDRILPLLLPSLQDKHFFLAIDLPGHGFSSHFPPGMTYHTLDCLLVIERIIRHYKWTLPINFMGHSLGAILGFLYSSTNPGKVDKMVAIDALTPIVFDAHEILNVVPVAMSESLRFEDKLATRKPPIYSYDDMLDRVLMSHLGGLDEESCKFLLSRGICETEPGSGLFHFTHDIRVQYLPIMTLSTKQVRFISENFQSQLLHINANCGAGYERPYVQKNVEKWIRSNSKAKSNRVVKFIKVDGFHHVHLMNPERISPEIIQFFAN